MHFKYNVDNKYLSAGAKDKHRRSLLAPTSVFACYLFLGRPLEE